VVLCDWETVGGRGQNGAALRLAKNPVISSYNGVGHCSDTRDYPLRRRWGGNFTYENLWSWQASGGAKGGLKEWWEGGGKSRKQKKPILVRAGSGETMITKK